MAAAGDGPRAYPPQTTGTVPEAVIFEVPALETSLRRLFDQGASLDYSIQWRVEERPAAERDLTSPLPAAPTVALVFSVQLEAGETFAVALGPHLWPILDEIAAKDAIGLTYALHDAGVLLLRNAADGLAAARAQLPAAE